MCIGILLLQDMLWYLTMTEVMLCYCVGWGVGVLSFLLLPLPSQHTEQDLSSIILPCEKTELGSGYVTKPYFVRAGDTPT